MFKTNISSGEPVESLFPTNWTVALSPQDTSEDELLTKYDVFLNEKIEYYHPVLYGIIISLSLVLLFTLKTIISKKRKKKKKKQLPKK